MNAFSSTIALLLASVAAADRKRMAIGPISSKEPMPVHVADVIASPKVSTLLVDYKNKDKKQSITPLELYAVLLEGGGTATVTESGWCEKCKGKWDTGDCKEKKKEKRKHCEYYRSKRSKTAKSSGDGEASFFGPAADTIEEITAGELYAEGNPTRQPLTPRELDAEEITPLELYAEENPTRQPLTPRELDAEEITAGELYAEENPTRQPLTPRELYPEGNNINDGNLRGNNLPRLALG